MVCGILIAEVKVKLVRMERVYGSGNCLVRALLTC